MPAGADNPWGSAFMKQETDLTNEAKAARVVDSTKARIWKIKNPAVRHVYSGTPSAPAHPLCQSSQLVIHIASNQLRAMSIPEWFGSQHSA